MKVQHTSPWRFFALTFGLSWLFWIPAALSGRDAMAFPAVFLLMAGGAGPAIAEILLIFRACDGELRRDYWQRVFDIRRIGGRWHAVIWLTFPLLNIVAILLSVLTGDAWPEFETAKRIRATATGTNCPSGKRPLASGRTNAGTS